MNHPLSIAAPLVMVVLAISLVIACIRLLRGPSLLDRVVALDLIGLATVAILACYSILASEPVFMRAATALALISFLGTIAFAYYVQKKGTE